MGYTSSYMKVSITFHGGAGAVTGSNFLLEVEGKKALIDCGLVQSSKFCDACNKPPFPYDPASIDTLIVTHAHIDHVGRIPLLLKEGFKGGIYSTIATRELAHELLLDAVEVMRQKGRAGAASLRGTRRREMFQQLERYSVSRGHRFARRLGFFIRRFGTHPWFGSGKTCPESRRKDAPFHGGSRQSGKSHPPGGGDSGGCFFFGDGKRVRQSSARRCERSDA